MPRVSAAHEQEVRERIVSAAIRVFTERGYGATIQDVVRDSGLSVGAIYTYFKSKEELFLECCEVMTSGSLETLGQMLAGKATTAERLETAIALLHRLDRQGARGRARARNARPGVGRRRGRTAHPRDARRRRERFVGAGQVLLREGVARGELPAWLDVDATARGYISLLDGLLLQRIEAGERYRPADLERQARAILDLVLAAARAPAPELSTTPG